MQKDIVSFAPAKIDIAELKIYEPEAASVKTILPDKSSLYLSISWVM
tara:strand:+ start:282 stop:422 length:141 start_codon:yes stop_codon:yes gene_type:complete